MAQYMLIIAIMDADSDVMHIIVVRKNQKKGRETAKILKNNVIMI